MPEPEQLRFVCRVMLRARITIYQAVRVSAVPLAEIAAPGVCMEPQSNRAARASPGVREPGTANRSLYTLLATNCQAS